MGNELKTKFKDLENPYKSKSKCIQSNCNGLMHTDKSLIRDTYKGDLNIRWLCNICNVKLDGFGYNPEQMPEIMKYLEE